jgi:hypothetical protein
VAKPAQIWRGYDPLIGVGLLIGSLVLIVLLLGGVIAVFDLGETGQDFAGAVLTIGFELLFAGAVLLLAQQRRISLRALGFRWPERWGPLGIAVAGTYGTLLAYGALIALLQELGADTDLLEGGNEIPIDEGLNALTLVGLLALFGVAVVGVAPLAEEIFFRALIFRGLDGIWPTWMAIAVSGLAFGAFHLNLSVLVPFTVIGMLFAWAFKASGSLWVTIIAHFIINTVSFIVTVIGVIN